MNKTFTVNGEQFLQLASGTTVNISELQRIYQAVTAQIKPGMSEQEIDAIIAATGKRMRPN